MQPVSENQKKIEEEKAHEDILYPYFRKVFIFISLSLLIWITVFLFSEIKELYGLSSLTSETWYPFADAALFVAILFEIFALFAIFKIINSLIK